MIENEAELIQKNLNQIEDEIPEDVVLCAVTKYHDLDETKEVIKNGIKDLGENKVQDLMKKIDQINEPVHWHMIGHLQTNKVKYLIDKVYLIQSVDSLKVLRKINNESKKKDKITDVLIQYNLTGEDQKFGFLEEETKDWINEAQNLDNVNIRGIMGMGPNTDDKEQIRQVFHNLKEIYDRINENYNLSNIHMEILSMGMSGDYPIAIEEGANLIRVGSKIFN